MSLRATWKGYLKLGEVICSVALYTAVSTSERVRLNMVNRRTGHALNRRFIDPETRKEVARADQVKGYEIASDEYVVLDPEEIAAVVPEGDKTLSVEGFIPCREVDDLYFDRPYYLRPADEVSRTSFAVIREGLRHKQVAALATGVLFRRPRSLLIRAHDRGIVATTLNYDYEVRSVADAFEDIPEVKIEGEMLDLARHIIGTRMGSFQPETFVDRYDDALADLVRAKIEGRKIAAPKEPERGKVVDLMDALRRSAGLSGKDGAKGAAAKRAKGAGTASTHETATHKSATHKSAARKTATRKAAARKAG